MKTQTEKQKQILDLIQLAHKKIDLLEKLYVELELENDMYPSRKEYEDKVLEQAYQEDRWQDKKWNAEDMAQEQYTEGQE